MHPKMKNDIQAVLDKYNIPSNRGVTPENVYRAMCDYGIVDFSECTQEEFEQGVADAASQVEYNIQAHFDEEERLS